MGHFDRDNRGGKFGKRDFGGRPNFGGGDRGGFRPKPFMHKATCSNCGAECEVPFKPTGDRPVYCNNCFKKGDNPGKFSGGTNFRERPQQSERRGGNAPAPGNTEQFKAQFEMLNNKLERILQALTENAAKEVSSEEVVAPKKSKAAKVKPAAKKAKKKSK